VTSSSAEDAAFRRRSFPSNREAPAFTRGSSGRALPRLALVLTLAPAAVWLAGCKSTDVADDAPAQGPTDPKLKLLPKTPSEGEIIFNDPTTRMGKNSGKKLKPTLIRITTRSSKGAVRDEPVRIQKGKAGDETTSDLTKRMFQQDRQQPATQVSAERFAELWAQLETIGIARLPRQRGGIPPEDKPSIIMNAGGRTCIFLRPSEPDVPAKQLPSDPQKLKVLLQTWGQAKMLIQMLLN
jgi:hypothetical protein